MASADRALRYGSIALGVIAALLLILAFLPWNMLRGPVASYASHLMERPVTIGGDLSVDWGRSTEVRLDDVTIGNANWSTVQPMAHARRLVFTYTLGSLLRGGPESVRMLEPDVLLERNADGEANWHFGGDSTLPLPRFRTIDVERGVVRYRDPVLDADLIVGLQSVAVPPGEHSALRFSGGGKLRGERFRMEGGSRGLTALRHPEDPYAMTLTAYAGRTTVEFDGTLVPQDPENVRGTLKLRGPDLSQLYPIVPSPLPWTPPYNLAGELSHTPGVWVFLGMKGKVGNSDLSGDVRIDVSKKRAMTSATLASNRFDYADLGGFIGLPPGESTQARTPEQQQETRRRASTYRVLPDRPIELAKLRAYDADVKFRGTSVKWGSVPIDNLVAHLVLKDGVMRFEPLDFGVAGGHVVSNVTLDVNRATAEVKGEIDARNVELKRVFPKLASPQGTAGRFGGRARFTTRGNSVAAMAAAADGEIAVSMRGGEASTLSLLMTNLDLANAAALLLKGDETSEIRCAIAAFHAGNGVLNPELLVVDSSAVVITGDGTIDLRDERYNLQLAAKSKRPSLLALRGPIVIGGTLRTPVVGPAVGPLAMRVGASVGLGAVFPPLALLPLIDLGGADDLDCRAMNQQARIETGTTERIARTPAPKSRAATAKSAAPSARASASTP